MTPIFAVILAAPVVLGITVLIYMFYYRRKINKRLAEGNISEKRNVKPMMPPIVFVLVTIICVSILAALLIVMLNFFSVGTGRSRNGFDGEPLIHLRMMHESDMENSPFEGYKTGDDIAGYEKYKETNGDVTFYYYIVKDNMQGVLPRLMIAADISKDPEGLERGFHVYASEGKRKLDLGGSGGCYLYAIDCNTFEGTIRLEEFCFDEELLFKHLSWEEKYDTAKIKGTLELDMSYPEPEE